MVFVENPDAPTATSKSPGIPNPVRGIGNQMDGKSTFWTTCR